MRDLEQTHSGSAASAAFPRPGPVAGAGRGLVQRVDLLSNLLWAELTARYKTATLGVLWFVLNPLLLMLILVVVFDHFIKLNIENYPVFVLSALLPWTYFQMGVSNAASSIPRASGLVKRVWIPRALIPLSAVLASLVHFLISLVLLFALMIAVDLPLTGYALLIPVAVVLQTALIAGIALLISSLNVFYRDVEHVLPPALIGLFYVTPIFYPLSYVPPAWRDWYIVNPMVGIIEIYRRTLLESALPSADLLEAAAIGSLVVLVLGVAVFRRSEPYFDDYV
ncbi:MAG: ABC transporter permease [Candidatus Binatia bacterium]